MSNPTRLFLLRHGEVEERYHRIFGGRIDMNLSPLGHAQAEALANYLQRVKFDAIYASPMKRAQQTLAPLAKQYQFEPSVIHDFREVDFGDWTGLGWEEVRTKYDVSAFQWLQMLEEATLPNGECSKTFRARVEPGLQQIIETHPGQNVAIVCHGGVIRMLLCILLEIPLGRFSGFEIEYASMTEVIITPTKTEVQLLNFTPWRDLK